MEKVFESLKNLYKGEEVVSKHLTLILLFIFPAILSGISSYIDKDTPHNIMLIMGIIALVLFVLSIVPWFWLLGYNVCFVENRMMKGIGIPKLDLEMLLEGVKVFPLVLVWSIYFTIMWIVILLLPFIPLITSDSKSIPEIIIAVLGFFIALFILMVVSFILLPFLNYVLIEYVKYGHQGYLYNPVTLFDFMKRSFKDTMMVFLKFLLVSIIVNIPIFAITMLSFAILLAVGVFSGSTGESLSPVVILLGVILGGLVSILQMYVGTMVGNAATENYIGVYNTVIEPEDKNSEGEDVPQQI